MENKKLEKSLEKIRHAWQIMAECNKFQQHFKDGEVAEFKRMLANHHKIVAEIVKINGHVLGITN